mgnify:CR=1 FL=1
MKTMKWLTTRYSVIQIAYWGAYCALSGYASVFLTGKGFTAGQTGALMALGNMVAALLQPMAAAAADRERKLTLKGLMLSIGGISAAALLALVITKKQFWAVCLAFAASTVSLQVLQPLLNALGMRYVNRRASINFGLARGLGSVGYASTSYLIGVLSVRLGENVIPVMAFLLCIPFLFVTLSFHANKSKETFDSRLLKKDTADRHLGNTGNLFSFLRSHGSFAVLLLGIVCMFTFHYMTNTYLFQMIQAVGGNSQNMGTAVSLAALTEIPAMALFSRLVKKIPVERLLRIAGVMWVVRSVLFCLCASVTGIYLVQLMQMVTYGLYIPASVYYADQVMDEDHKVQGQALVTVAFTLGSVFGNFLGGVLIDQFRVSVMLMTGVFFTLAGGICFFVGTRQAA